MKLKLLQILAAAYIVLFFFLTKEFSIIPLALFIIVLLVDLFTSIRSGIKNLLYFLAALSAFMPIFSMFLVYLPFSVFGFLLTKKGFVKNYVLGFTLSFIPSIFIYLISTYLSIRLSLPMIWLIFFILPIIAFFLLRKKSLETLDLNHNEGLLLFIILFFTTTVAVGIVDNGNLFISNGTREYTRVQYAVSGLLGEGLIPIYNPGIGQGEATFLWDAPGRASNYIISNSILKFIPPILFFNAHSFFILFMHVLALSLLIGSIVKQKKSTLMMLAIAGVTVLIGLNFFFLQKLESIKFFAAFPLAYLLVSLIIGNPTKLKEFFIMMFIASIIMTLHSGYGIGVIMLSFSIFIIRKAYYLKNREEIKHFFGWFSKNKLILPIILLIMIFLPMFYFSAGVIYKDALRNQDSLSEVLSSGAFTKSVIGFFKGFFEESILMLTLRYPDVQRIDDHVTGPFVSVFGVISFIALIMLYRSKNSENFRAYAFGFILYLIIASLINFYSINFSLLRSNEPYFLILLGVSIIAFIGLFGNKIAKIALIAVVYFGVFYSLPYSMQNINNIHRETFASGTGMQQELDFIRQLPVDGRIMTYGLFNNAIDFGSNSLTGRYFSREEREELIYHIRNIYYLVHGPQSFGQEEYVLNKSNEYLSNLLRLGGYKYIFANLCHPMGNFILNKIYPDYSYPIYQNQQNQCLAVFAINGTSYAEKIDLAEDVNEEIYNRKDGYKYTTISRNYDYDLSDFELTSAPKDPEPLEFERLSDTKIRIYGDFEENEWILFKERYWPRWKAYVDGKEVPIFPDEFEQILVKTVKGNEIILEYSVARAERTFGILSVIGFFGLSVLLLYLLRKKD
tara:strand:+ start:14550 stop:17093 length:2544 start_codon:yes stop_codon:yes gene_type:complete